MPRPPRLPSTATLQVRALVLFGCSRQRSQAASGLTPPDFTRIVPAPTPTTTPELPSPVSLREVVARCVDISSPPKKVILRLLAEACSSPVDADRLRLLSRCAGHVYTVVRVPQLVRSCSVLTSGFLRVGARAYVGVGWPVVEASRRTTCL